MPDDITTDKQSNGGTTGKVYTEDEVKKLLAESEKKGQATAWKHWQSIHDKALSAEKAKTAQEKELLLKELNDLKQKQLESLTPEERQRVLLEEIYKRMESGSNKPSRTETLESPQDEEYVSEGTVNTETIRAEVGAVLKEMNVDPDKVDWGEGTTGMEAMKRFLKSIVTQLKSSEKPSESSEADRLDLTRSTNFKPFDLKSINTAELITAGLKKKSGR